MTVEGLFATWKFVHTKIIVLDRQALTTGTSIGCVEILVITTTDFGDRSQLPFRSQRIMMVIGNPYLLYENKDPRNTCPIVMSKTKIFEVFARLLSMIIE